MRLHVHHTQDGDGCIIISFKNVDDIDDPIPPNNAWHVMLKQVEVTFSSHLCKWRWYAHFNSENEGATTIPLTKGMHVLLYKWLQYNAARVVHEIAYPF